MKKNKMMRIASVLLVAVLLSTCAISGTFAKYATSANGSDNARVAKWDVKITEKGEESFAFDLFETIKDTDGTSDETHVAAGLIAPGTQGSFTISLASNSEVTANYKVDYTVTNTDNIPIKFSVNGGQSWTDDLTDVTGTITADAATFSQDITVQWKWDFGEDIDDNTHGTGNKQVTVAVTVSFEQVD